MQATKEHVRCLFNGGTREFDNEVMACFKCNNGRNKIEAFYFYRLVQQEGKDNAIKIATKIRADWDRKEASFRKGSGTAVAVDHRNNRDGGKMQAGQPDSSNPKAGIERDDRSLATLAPRSASFGPRSVRR